MRQLRWSFWRGALSPRKAWQRAKVSWQGTTMAELTDTLGTAREGATAFTLAEPLGLEGFTREVWTFGDVADFVGCSATVLLRQGGVMPGERVVICTRNLIDQPLLTLAVMRCGAVAVPLNHQLRAREIRFIVEDCRARTMIVDREVWDDVVGPALAAGALGKGPERVLITGDGAPTSSAVEVVGLWSEIAKVQRAAAPVPVDPEGVCAVMYTSGTTGFPKGAMLTHRSLLRQSSALTMAPEMPHALLSALPMAHIMGLGAFVAMLCSGIPMVYLARFQAAQVLEWLESGQVDAFLGVPSMYQALVEAGALERDLSAVGIFASAADVMPGDLIAQFKRAGRSFKAGPVQVPAVFVEVYGSVELSGPAMVRISPPWLEPAQGGFIGWPLPGIKVRVLDDQGRELPVGEVGELWVHSKGALQGYLGREEATREALQQGWFRTGDLAARTWTRALRFVGREKDVIKSGGFSVFPAEIETILLLHPAVEKAVVVGVQHARRGAVPVAFVCGEVSLEAIEDWLSGRVARYKQPWDFVGLAPEELPYGATGKVKKTVLQTSYEAGQYKNNSLTGARMAGDAYTKVC